MKQRKAISMKGASYSMDLIIRNAKLIDQANLVDIAIKDGKFQDIRPKIDLATKTEIDANGKLVSPPFVESHVHLDSALTAGNPRFNQSGTLLEGIEIWGECKQHLTKDMIKEHAKITIKWLIANGVLRIRAHTDCSDPELTSIQAILELKEELQELIDIQVVAFPQNGIFTYDGMDQLLVEAVKMGADVIGGIPHIELTREDGIKSIEYIFSLADKYDKLIDIHTDETGDEQSRFAEVIAKYAITYGMNQRVTASHVTAMHNYHNDYAQKLISQIVRANMNIVTNPFSNALLQNRLDGYPRRRGHTRVDELLDSGVNVSIGNDNIMDPFNPMGKGNMLQAAHFLLHIAHLSGHQQIKQLFAMITEHGAKTLHDQHYGIKPGQQADCIILDAKSAQEAIRLTSECLYVIRKGNIIAETKPANRKVYIDHEAVPVDFKLR